MGNFARQPAVKSCMGVPVNNSLRFDCETVGPCSKWAWSALVAIGLSVVVGCKGTGTPYSEALSSWAHRSLGLAKESMIVESSADDLEMDRPSSGVTAMTDVRKPSHRAARKAEPALEARARSDALRPVQNSGLSRPTETDEDGDDNNESNAIEFVAFRQPESGNDSQTTTESDPSKIESDFTQSLRLTFPAEIPGANVPRLSLPGTQGGDDPKLVAAKQAAIEQLFPSSPEPITFVVSTQRKTTLAELEQLALENSPIITQALASITVSQGAAFQAGVYPNPVFGYEADTVGSSYTRNYQGVYLSQLVKTANKLPLQRAAANMELMNAQLAYERTQLEVLRLVRAGYYNVLVSQEATRINGGLVHFTNRVLEIMKDRLSGGKQAPYEVSQMRSLVKQAYTAKVQSEKPVRFGMETNGRGSRSTGIGADDTGRTS